MSRARTGSFSVDSSIHALLVPCLCLSLAVPFSFFLFLPQTHLLPSACRHLSLSKQNLPPNETASTFFYHLGPPVSGYCSCQFAPYITPQRQGGGCRTRTKY